MSIGSKVIAQTHTHTHTTKTLPLPHTREVTIGKTVYLQNQSNLFSLTPGTGKIFMCEKEK